MPHICTSTENYKEQLEKAGSTLVVVDFYADWCGPCRMIAPVLEKIQNEKEGKVIILKVNVDELEDVAQEEGIEAMPTFKLFKNGKVIETFCGANQEKLRKLIDDNL